MVQKRRKRGALAGGCSSRCSESAAPGQIISLSIGTGRSDWQAGPALKIRACDIQRNLFIPKAFCVLHNTPTDMHYRNLFIFCWKAAISREEYGSFLQRCFKISCSELYPVPIPCFSSSLLSLLAPPAPHFEGNLLKSLFFHPVPAVSSLILLLSTLLSVGHHYSLGLITATQPSFPLTFPVLKGMCHFSLPPLIFSFWPSFSFAHSHLSHLGDTCPSWHIFPLQCGLPACFAMTQVFSPGLRRAFRQDVAVTS